jgi:hypothetical protein
MKNILKYLPRRKIKNGRTHEVVEGFCLVISLLRLSRPNTGMDYDGDVSSDDMRWISPLKWHSVFNVILARKINVNMTEPVSQVKL